jgi:cysteinyl-tRNA synthetase
MSLRLYNTMTRKKESFSLLKGKEVRMYSCGPTLYDFAHVGNFRAYIFSDVIRRYLEYRGFKVKLIMNLTDVDDKTIKGSRKERVPLHKYTEKYKAAFFEDIKTLNIKPAFAYPEATDHIREMVEIIKVLLKKGFAYKSKDGTIYFDISKFKDYGKLAKLDKKGLKAGARVSQDEYEKEQANDFALWKAWSKEDGRVFWDTEIGKGRPGWHIECSAMSSKYLGHAFDIHTGGVDLIFPHHENEIAQYEAATGKKFVRFWLHNEHLLVDGKKMSKSLGNFYTLRDIFDKGYNPKAVRYILLATHYRQRLNFTLKGLEAAEASVSRLLDFMDMLDEAGGQEFAGMKKIVDKSRKGFGAAMDDDLNIAGALAAVFNLVKEINVLSEKGKLGKKGAKMVKDLMLKFDKVLGVLEMEKHDLSAEIESLILERERARKAKDWQRADEIRARLKEMGVILEDTQKGVRWKMR